MNYRDGRPAVLVVEDDPALLHLLELVLAGGGFDVVAAGKAADGLAQVRRRKGGFDLAILDIVMPGVSGLDLAGDLDREFPSLKILYISGFVGSLAAQALARRSPDRVLLKPFSDQDLLDRVRTLIGPPPPEGVGETVRSGPLGK